MPRALRKKALQVPRLAFLRGLHAHLHRSLRLTDRSTADTITNHGSQPPTPTGSALPDRAQSSAGRPSASSTSHTPAVEDATTDSVMTSVETLPPNTSQASANSGPSKRVLSNGRQVVLNSDSDSDSVGDIDFGIPAPKPKPATLSSRSSRRTAVAEPELRKPPKSAKTTGKRSFSQLVETAQKNLDTERLIQEQKAGLDKVDEQPAPVAIPLDKNTLKHAMQDGEDSDQADRLYKAMQRTNEVQTQTSYHFFEAAPSMSLMPPFPKRSLPDHGWTACFQGMGRSYSIADTAKVIRLFRSRPSLHDWICTPDLSSTNATYGACHLDDRSE